MKKSYKKHIGFTLIEVIISMSLIAVISIGIYNGYVFLIMQTKEGEIKQISSLVGKQVTEDIKSISREKNIKLNEDTIELTENMQFVKDGDKYTCTQVFDKNGKKANDTNYEYKAKIEMALSRNDAGEKISINNVENNNLETDIFTVYIIKDESGRIILSNTDTNDDIEINEDIAMDIKIEKKSDNDYIGCITMNGKSLEYEFKEKNMQMNLDLIYCKNNIKINVDNISKKTLNLCILNGKNTEIINKKGILNEYYRSQRNGRIGDLYNINIEIFNKSNEIDSLFKTNFVQNIDIG